MALTKEDLQQIQSIFQTQLQTELKPIVERLDKLESKVDKLDKRLGFVEFTVENLTKDVDKIKKLEGL